MRLRGNVSLHLKSYRSSRATLRVELWACALPLPDFERLRGGGPAKPRKSIQGACTMRDHRFNSESRRWRPYLYGWTALASSAMAFGCGVAPPGNPSDSLAGGGESVGQT